MKKIIFSSIFLCSIAIPTSKFPSSYNTNSQQDGLISFLNQLFSFFTDDDSVVSKDYSDSQDYKVFSKIFQTNTNYFYIGNKKVSKEECEEYFKKKNQTIFGKIGTVSTRIGVNLGMIRTGFSMLKRIGTIIGGNYGNKEIKMNGKFIIELDTRT